MSKLAEFLHLPTSRKTASIVAASAVALGLLFGSSIAASTAQAELAQLETDVAEAEALISDLEVEVEEAERRAERASDEADAARKAADSAKAKLTTANSKVAELETQTLANQGEIAARDARISELETQAASQRAPAVVEPLAPKASAAYYKNCTAARAAGAAPVRVGDPGYGTHLDRDGDGIGCE